MFNMGFLYSNIFFSNSTTKCLQFFYYVGILTKFLHNISHKP